MIEVAESGEPLGKFIAVQIKTGKSNFHCTEKKITHYVTHVHRHYWLNLNLPIILVGHLPEKNETLWSPISSQTLKRTDKGWKVDISRHHELNSKSKNRLVILTTSAETRPDMASLFTNEFKAESVEDHGENSIRIKQSNESISLIEGFMHDLGRSTKLLRKNLHRFEKQGLSIEDNVVKARIKSHSSNVLLTATRINSEIENFALCFSHGILSYEYLIAELQSSPNSKAEIRVLRKAKKTMQELSETIEGTIDESELLIQEIRALPRSHSSFKKANGSFIHVMEGVIKEYSTASQMVVRVANSIIH